MVAIAHGGDDSRAQPLCFFNLAHVVQHLHRDLLAIDFPSFSDGRGFSLARRLRELGFKGRLRASGRLIVDQYAMARRVGFDEVEVAPDIAARYRDTVLAAGGSRDAADLVETFLGRPYDSTAFKRWLDTAPEEAR